MIGIRILQIIPFVFIHLNHFVLHRPLLATENYVLVLPGSHCKCVETEPGKGVSCERSQCKLEGTLMSISVNITRPKWQPREIDEKQTESSDSFHECNIHQNTMFRLVGCTWTVT